MAVGSPLNWPSMACFARSHPLSCPMGTLRYLLWIAALLTPRPPPLMILNEPETSLHPDLLPALGRLVARASRQSQIVVVTHAAGLLPELGAAAGVRRIVLEKQLAETLVQDNETFSWTWPAR